MTQANRNIVITPNINQPGQPNIVYTGNANYSMSTVVADDNSIFWQNPTGQLFSIANNVTTGTIFAVSDISGVPFISVNASGNVSLVPLGGANVGIGTSSPIYGLDLWGNARITSSMLTGNISITNITVSTSTTTGALILRGGAGIAGNVYVGGNINITNTAQAISTTTGALIVSGGGGITGNLFVNGSVNGANINVTGASVPPNGLWLPAANTLGFATSSAEKMRITSTGSVGIGSTIPRSWVDASTGDPQITLHNINDVTGSFWQNTFLSVQFGMYNPSAATVGIMAASTQRTLFAFDIFGRVGTTTNSGANPSVAAPVFRNIIDDGNSNANFAGNLTVVNSTNVGNIAVNNITVSTSTTTGALIMRGGAGIAGNVYVGGNINVTNTTASGTTLPGTGALVLTTGGAYIAGNVVAGSFQPTSSTIANVGIYLPIANRLAFATLSTAQMLLTSNGNVMIGTAATANASGATATVVINNAVGGGIELVSNNSGGGNISALTAGGLSFSTFTGAVGSEAYTQRLIINSLGNVGIGTNTVAAGNVLTVFGGNIFVQGAVYATSDIIANFSDARLKTNIIPITNALNLVSTISGVYYNANQLAAQLTGEDITKNRVGVLAQEIDAIMPEIIRPAPFDMNPDGSSKSGENYITVQYERLIPLLIQAIKEQQTQLKYLESRINALEDKI